MANLRSFAVLAFAAFIVPMSAQAQYYGTAPQGAPLYPYAVQSNRPYAVEVAPGTYEIRRPGVGASSYAEPRTRRAERNARRVTHNDRAVIEELRQRHAAKQSASKVAVINTKKIVRGKPIVIEHTRVVDDPPKVIVRKHYVDDTTASIPRSKQKVAIDPMPKPDKRDDGKKRVIEADAEITIIGPDRMSIRLFRKRAAQAKASADTED